MQRNELRPFYNLQLSVESTCERLAISYHLSTLQGSY
jgi:hypothetical protein